MNAQGVQTQQETVQKVQSFNRPHSQKTVKSFLGLCNYYRPFVPNFAADKLLGKDTPFKWNKKCEEAFQILKELLTSAPVCVCVGCFTPYRQLGSFSRRKQVWTIQS